MLDLVPLVKPLHVLVALASGAGFALRGIWMLRGSAWLEARALQLSPTAHPWLAAKLLLLLAYIGAGMLALRRGRTRRVRAAAFVFALACYALILLSALTHRPLGL